MREKTITIGSPRDAPIDNNIDHKTKKLTIKVSEDVSARKMVRVMRSYPSVTSLMIECLGKRTVDMRFLKKIQELKLLSICGFRLKSFEFLTEIVSLRTFIYRCSINEDEDDEEDDEEDEPEPLSLSHLVNLIYLKELQLAIHGPLEDVVSIDHLGNLKRLVISNTTNPIDIVPLISMPIEDLVLRACHLEGNMNLSKNDKLKTLCVAANNLDSITFSKRAKPIYINCRLNEHLSEINSLNPAKLCCFIAPECSFDHISFLSGAPNLTHVFLCDNPAKNIRFSEIQDSRDLQHFCTNAAIPFLQDCGTGIAAQILEKFMKDYYELCDRAFEQGDHLDCYEMMEDLAREHCLERWSDEPLEYTDDFDDLMRDFWNRNRCELFARRRGPVRQ